MSKYKKIKLLSWAAINIFLPLLPLLIKTVLFLFTSPERIGSIVILENTELLFYDLFTSIIFLNILSDKANSGVWDYLIKYFTYLIQLIIIILIVLNYLKIANSSSLLVACTLSVLCPIVTIVVKYRMSSNEVN